MEPLRTPEELIFRACYAPIDLRRMLEDSESRSRIRRLPVQQLFYGLKELDGNRVPELLPHVTEEQWTGVLDLDIWDKDEMTPSRFLHWQKQIVDAPDAIGRKLIRAAEPALWRQRSSSVSRSSSGWTMSSNANLRSTENRSKHRTDSC